MKAKNLTTEEQAALLNLLALVAAGNTETDEIQQQAESLLQNIEGPREELADALREFRNAALRLDNVWQKHSTVAAELGQFYPLGKDFSETAYDIANWTKLHIERLDPPPDDVPATN